MTTSVHYTVLIECNLSCIHSVSSLLTFDLCMCTWRTLFHWWRRHSVWWCPQTSCCGQGVLSLHLCCFMPTSLHVYGCCFRVAFLEGPLLGTSEDIKPLQCSRYWSAKKLGMHQTPHEVVISCLSLQFSDQLLWYTHCRHCTLSRSRWEGEGVVQNSKHS